MGSAVNLIDGVVLTSLKKIQHPLGDVFHAMKASEYTFEKFGEAYFSTVNYQAIKGWKKHTEMVLNLVVPVGEIRFVIYDDREGLTKGHFFDVTLSQDNYQRLTVAPGLWLAFQGVGSNLNLLLNIASLEHNPTEAISITLDKISYDW